MKKVLFTVGLMLALSAGVVFANEVNGYDKVRPIGIKYEDDRKYCGVGAAIPFSFDAIGVQAFCRDDAVEIRAGLDTRGKFQAGVGLTAGDSEGLVPSIGLAYSSHHKTIVPYGALTNSDEDSRDSVDDDFYYGIVSYGYGDLETTYGVAGLRDGWEGDEKEIIYGIPNDRDEFFTVASANTDCAWRLIRNRWNCVPFR